MVAEFAFLAPPARPLVRNSTPTRNARSCCSDGFSTALGSFRELFCELFLELSRLLSLESSRRKQTHFILRWCRERNSRSPPPPGTPPPTSHPCGCGLRAK